MSEKHVTKDLNPCSVCSVNEDIWKLIRLLWQYIVSTLSVSHCTGADPLGSMSHHSVFP